MPGFNQIGPMGQGPKTGRQMGRCTNFGAKLKLQPSDINTTTENSDENLTDTNFGLGMGIGRGKGGRGGRGQGMGRQNRFRGGN